MRACVSRFVFILLPVGEQRCQRFYLQKPEGELPLPLLLLPLPLLPLLLLLLDLQCPQLLPDVLPMSCARVFFRGFIGKSNFLALYCCCCCYCWRCLPIHACTHTHTRTRSRTHPCTDTHTDKHCAVTARRPRPIRGEIIFRIFSTKLHINVVVQTNFYFRIFQLRFIYF